MNTNYFNECRTLQEVKQTFKRLALLHHPDRGGDTGIMQLINSEYAAIIKDPFFGFSLQQEDVKESFVRFPEIISQIISFDDVAIEICKNWIWLSGNTFRYKEQLKAIGFRYSGDKKLWYWRPVEFRSNNREPLPIEAIRVLHGSDAVDKPQEPKKIPVLKITEEMLEKSFQSSTGRAFEESQVEYISASFND